MIVYLGQFLDLLGKHVITVEVLIIWLLTAGKRIRRRLKLVFQMLEVRQSIISLNNLVFIVAANGIPFMCVLIIINYITVIMMLCQSLIKMQVLIKL